MVNYMVLCYRVDYGSGSGMLLSAKWKDEVVQRATSLQTYSNRSEFRARMLFNDFFFVQMSSRTSTYT